MFRFSTARSLMMHQRRAMSSAQQATVHQPFKLKPVEPYPKSVGAQDMVTELWAVNPGVVVGLSSVGAFVIGVGVHMITKGTQVNAGVEHAMHEEKEAAKKVIASQYVP